MRTSILPQTQPAPVEPLQAKTAATAFSTAPNSKCSLKVSSCANVAVLVALVASAALLGAQTPATQPPALQTASTQAPIGAHKRPSAGRPVVAPAPVAQVDP